MVDDDFCDLEFVDAFFICSMIYFLRAHLFFTKKTNKGLRVWIVFLNFKRKDVRFLLNDFTLIII